MVTPKLRPVTLPMLMLLTVISVGCSSLQTKPADPMASGSETTSITDPVVVVELRNGNDEREYLRAPLKDSMLVQDALKGSGAVNRFRRMEVVLVRHLPDGGKLRLPVRYVSTSRRVANEHNYALHGGDWLEVTEDTSTTFDRMVDQALEPLRPVMRNHRE